MKKSLVLVFVVFINSLFAMTQEDIMKYKENNLLKSDNIKLILGKKIDDEFALLKGYIETPNGISPLEIVTNNKIVITGGNVFDAKTKNKIEIDINYEKFKKDSTYEVGKGKEELFLFTDGECPYCGMFEENLSKLKKEYKLYVFMYPLEQIHYFAKDMAIATLSQPKDKRAKYFKKLIDLNKSDKTKLLEELEKYSVDLYKKVSIGVNSFGTNSRAGQLSQKYISYFEKRENKKFSSIVEVVDYCNSKIKKFENDKTLSSRLEKVEEIFKKQQIFSSGFVGVQGTPSLISMDGKRIDIEKVLNK